MPPPSHKVMKRPPLAPEVHAGWWPKASRTATSPLGPTKKGRAAGPCACSEEPAARRVAINMQLRLIRTYYVTVSSYAPCVRK